MTRAQKAIHRTMTNIITEVGEPMTVKDTEELISLLRAVKEYSIWGAVIRDCFENGGDLYFLIESLSLQATENFLGMISIVGREATVLLLRSYPR